MGGEGVTAFGDRVGVGGARGSVEPAARPIRRLSLGHVAVTVAAILAFVANVAFLRASDASEPVVAATEDLPAGHVIGPSDLTVVDVRADASVLSTLLTSTEGLEGRVVRTPLPAGALVGTSDLLEEAAGDGRRAMAVPVSAPHAAGGTIRVGDRVDVVDVGDIGAAYVARDLEVVAVSDVSSAALGVASGDHLVLAVDEADVLAVADAIADGEIDVVVTTGARGG